MYELSCGQFMCMSFVIKILEINQAQLNGKKKTNISFVQLKFQIHESHQGTPRTTPFTLVK
jgi:hypothetical protein